MLFALRAFSFRHSWERYDFSFTRDYEFIFSASGHLVLASDIFVSQTFIRICITSALL